MASSNMLYTRHKLKHDKYCSERREDINRMKFILDRLSSKRRRIEIQESLDSALTEHHNECIKLFLSYREFQLINDIDKESFLWNFYSREFENIAQYRQIILKNYEQCDIDMSLENEFYDEEFYEHTGLRTFFDSYQSYVLDELRDLNYNVEKFVLDAAKERGSINVEVAVYLNILKDLLLNGYGATCSILNKESFHIALDCDLSETVNIIENDETKITYFEIYSHVFYELKQCGANELFTDEFTQNVNSIIADSKDGNEQPLIKSLQNFKNHYLELKNNPLSLMSCVRLSLIKNYKENYLTVVNNIDPILPNVCINFLKGSDFKY